MQALERKRVIVRILKLGLDTQPPGGKLRPRGLGGVAQFEPNASTPTARHCQAKSLGKYKGGEPFAPERRWKVLQLAVEGATKKRIARRLGLEKPSCIEFWQLPEEVVRCVMINA